MIKEGLPLASNPAFALTKNADFDERIANINTRGHNFLRITRIIKCLGELGLACLIGPMMSAMMHDAFITHKLANARDSFANYWIPCIREDHLRNELLARVAKYAREGTDQDDSMAGRAAPEEL